MKLQGQQAERFVQNPDAGVRAILLYGPDGGLVRERAAQLARTVVEDLTDAFRVAEFSAATLKDDPARLSDEAASLSLTGGRRVVRLRGATDTVAGTVQDFLAAKVGEALVIVESGDLPVRSRLRSLFEQADDAAAIACYNDDGRALDEVIRETLGRYDVTVSEEAAEYLCENLGSDRGVSRNELEKLALYAGSPGHVALEDAVACVGDSAAMTLEDIAFAAAGGDQATLSRGLTRAYQEGASPVAVLRVVCRHFQRLQLAAGHIARGQAPDRAMQALRPRVYFKRTDAFRDQLRRWRPAELAAALESLTEAEVACKSTGMPAQAVCGRTLMRLAYRAGQRRPRP